jgi:electron-transferring-flavoprotein dehydrogenase
MIGNHHKMFGRIKGHMKYHLLLKWLAIVDVCITSCQETMDKTFFLTHNNAHLSLRKNFSMNSHDSMEFDVVIVGAGPAGLSAAIRLLQLDNTLNICILEKGAEVGAHILSGAVIEPRALDELIPDWKDKNAPLHTPVTEDHFLFLTKHSSYRLPTPPQMHNQGNYIISLGQLCRWLAQYAEQLGANIFPGFAATNILYSDNQVCGIETGAKGIDKEGNPTSSYQPGMHLYAKYVFFAEGCRGSLTQTLFDRFDLRKQSDPQSYGLGIKELWEIPEDLHEAGKVVHSIGWPLNNKTYGGSFIYHLGKNILAIGFVTGLDYQNPYLNPYKEFQRFKTHPMIQPLLSNSKRIAYGARALNEGGLQAIPQLIVPGGLIIGCAAGFLNVPKIKGIHTAMKSGMIAAESVLPLLQSSSALSIKTECHDYPLQLKNSWIWEELTRARNIRPAMNWGLFPGLIYSAFDTYLLRGKAPWTLHNHADYLQLKSAKNMHPIDYPKENNKTTYDLMSSVFMTHSFHDENQPCHLKLKDPYIPIDVNLKLFAGPEQRYCPAGVYEFINKDTPNPRLQINAANCIHCKACDIKDPTQNIVWTPPEGGSGPQYEMM